MENLRIETNNNEEVSGYADGTYFVVYKVHMTPEDKAICAMADRIKELEQELDAALSGKWVGL